MRHVALTVNGTRHELELEPRELLVYVLRERLGLTGTSVGCDTSSCGACTVLLNGEWLFDMRSLRADPQTNVFWAVGNGANGLDPSQSTLNLDDASIRRAAGSQ